MLTTLVSATQLAAHLGDADWRIIDCRHDLMNPEAGRIAYQAGHIPGALFANLDQDLSGTKTDEQGIFQGRHPLPRTEDLLQVMRNLGISDRTQVIAYDAHGGMFAARLWWLLRSIGHASVAVLDGGVPAWIAAGQGLITEVLPPALGSLSLRSALTAQVDVQAVLANLNQTGVGARQVIDARAPDRFRGENESIDPIGGHIPGARNRFFKDNLDANGCFKTAEQLREEWQSVIVQPEQAIMQCGSGVTACHNLLALEIAGLKGAALYPGSWSQWCADPTRPVARGEF